MMNAVAFNDRDGLRQCPRKKARVCQLSRTSRSHLPHLPLFRRQVPRSRCLAVLVLVLAMCVFLYRPAGSNSVILVQYYVLAHATRTNCTNPYALPLCAWGMCVRGKRKGRVKGETDVLAHRTSCCQPKPSPRT